ncbi:hypothetical protein LSAT2_030642 [Lamellibrachia satsuma]|nr:hypothetical protein LSAT2_030642 [Lamellibrachia satsuma]
MICTVCAAGAYFPPFMIFPRKRMVNQLMQGAPPQSVGHASASGWTDAGLFLKWMEHFVLYTNASTQNRHLIVLDGHHSHKTLDAVNYARVHGIELITLPPHCTHNMQPLDRCYFKSLKSAYNVPANNWMTSHHGQRITFYDVAGIFGTAFLRTSTPDKAISGFRACGLWPFDDTIFQDNEFAAAADFQPRLFQDHPAFRAVLLRLHASPFPLKTPLGRSSRSFLFLLLRGLLHLQLAYYIGRNDLKTLMASGNCADWAKISELLLGPVPGDFEFLPKHKANVYQ